MDRRKYLKIEGIIFSRKKIRKIRDQVDAIMNEIEFEKLLYDKATTKYDFKTLISKLKNKNIYDKLNEEQLDAIKKHYAL